MLKILRTFCGGIGSLVTSLGSARSSAWLSGRAWGAFSLPEDLVIFLLGLDDEKRGIGQCRSIANPGLVGHIPEEANLWDFGQWLNHWISLEANSLECFWVLRDGSKCPHQVRCPGLWPLLKYQRVWCHQWDCWAHEQLSCTGLPPPKHTSIGIYSTSPPWSNVPSEIHIRDRHTVYYFTSPPLQ